MTPATRTEHLGSERNERQNPTPGAPPRLPGNDRRVVVAELVIDSCSGCSRIEPLALVGGSLLCSACRAGGAP